MIDVAKLIENTVVTHPDTGEAVVLHAGEDVPSWGSKLIGEHLLDAKPRPTREPASPDGSLPPKSGAGSSKAAWLAYARTAENAAALAAADVTIADDAAQGEIIAALESAGITTEKD